MNRFLRLAVSAASITLLSAVPVVAIVIDEVQGCTRTGRFQRPDVDNVRSFLDDFVTLP